MSTKIRAGVLMATSSKILVIFGGQYFSASFSGILGKKVFNIYETFQQNISWGVQGYTSTKILIIFG